MTKHQSKIEKLIAELAPNGVEFKELGKVARILNGYAFKSGKYSDSGIRVIRISDVQKGRMSDKDLKFYPLDAENEIKNYLLQENDLVMSLTGNVGRVAMLSKQHLPAGLNQRVACIRAKDDVILTRYLFHFFDQSSFEKDAMANATGGGQKNMSTVWLSRYKIPIPPIDVQQEIVNILDKFTSLEAELEAELEARKEQYEYYRSQLLAFPEGGARWVRLIDISEIKTGQTPGFNQIKEIGQYPYINAGTEPSGFLENMNSESETITVPSRGQGGAGHVGYQKHDFWCGPLCYRIRSKNNEVMTKYLYFYLKNIQRSIVGLRQTGSIPAVNKKELELVKIPVPPLPEQEHIVSVLDKFDTLVSDISVGLPAELNARCKQYEYYRGRLLAFKEIKMV